MSASTRLDLTDLRPSRRRRARRILVRLLVVAIVLAVFAAIGGWHTPLMLGLVGVGVTVWRAIFITDGIHRLRVVLTGIVLTASVVAWSWMNLRLVTIGGICTALTLYPALHMFQRRGLADNRSGQRTRLVRGLLIGAAIVSTALAVLGTFERNQASFAIRYGQPITVIAGPDCVDIPLEGLPCLDATWTINGTTYHGELHVGPRELASKVAHAYAYPGDARAYSAQDYSANIDGLELVGFVPPWLAIIGLIGLVIGALPARVRNRIRLLGRVD